MGDYKSISKPQKHLAEKSDEYSRSTGDARPKSKPTVQKHQSLLSTTPHSRKYSSVPNHSEPTRLMQNFTLVWLDQTIKKFTSPFRKPAGKFQDTCIDQKLFVDPNECIKYLKSCRDGKIILITSGSLGQGSINSIHPIAQVDSILVFCKNIAKNESWARAWPKIEGVYDSDSNLLKRLQKLIRQCDLNSMPLSYISNKSITETELSQLQQDQSKKSFIYSMLFKEIILELPNNNEKCVQDLVSYCSQQSIFKSQWKEFEKQYRNKSAIEWYTSRPFISSILNRALCVFDIELLFKMSFFIRDLHDNLEELYNSQEKDNTDSVTLYFGQSLSKEDFNSLHNTKGGLLSFNSFFTAVEEKHRALSFVKKAINKNEEMKGAFFIINIDRTKISTSKTPFVTIKDNSDGSTQQQILFAMNTVFRVDEIEPMEDNDRLVKVKLTIANKKDSQLIALNQSIRHGIGGDVTGWCRMGKVMLQMNDFRQAELLCGQTLRNASSDKEKALARDILAKALFGQKRYDEAGRHWEENIRLCSTTHIDEHSILDSAYNYLGQSYYKRNEFTDAVKYYKNLLKLRQGTFPPFHRDLAASYNNVSLAYEAKESWLKAVQYAEKAYKIKLKATPSNYSDLAYSSYKIGKLHHKLNENAEAIQFIKQAIKHEKQSSNPDTTKCTKYENAVAKLEKCSGEKSHI